MTKILVFGENPNDTRALRELVLGLCPALGPGDVKILRDPPTLQRNAGASTIRNWVQRAAASLRAARVALGDAVCILAHTDADGPDDGSFAATRTAELRAAGFRQAHAVTPTESIEAWWLLFPDATESVVPSWSGALSRQKRDVDRVPDPKGELTRRTRAKQPKRPYRESDSPAVAKAVAARGELRSPAGASDSYRRFVETAGSCCALASSASPPCRAALTRGRGSAR